MQEGASGDDASAPSSYPRFGGDASASPSFPQFSGDVRTSDDATLAAPAAIDTTVIDPSTSSSSFQDSSVDARTRDTSALAAHLATDATAKVQVGDNRREGARLSQTFSGERRQSVRTVLDDMLLRRSPAEAASWLLNQARELRNPDNATLDRSRRLPIFEVARDLQALPAHEKQELTHKMLGGVLELNDTDRAELVSVGLRVSAQTQSMARSDEVATDTALARNLEALVSESGVQDWPVEDVEAFSQSLEHEASALVKDPQIVLSLARKLPPEDRAVLEEVLVQNDIVPGGQRELFEVALRPGGFLDKADEAQRWLNAASAHSWLFPTLPIVEFLVACCMYNSPCRSYLGAWLYVDSVGAIFVAAAVFYVSVVLRPTYEAFLQDPIGAARRWQAAVPPDEEVDTEALVELRLEAAIPGTVTSGRYTAARFAFSIIVVFVLLGLVWLVLGVVAVCATVVISCDSIMFIWVVLVVLFRIIALIFVAENVHSAWAEMKTSSSLNSFGYGTMDRPSQPPDMGA